MTFFLRVEFKWTRTIPNAIRNSRISEEGVYTLTFEAATAGAAVRKKESQIEVLKEQWRTGQNSEDVYSEPRVKSSVLAKVVQVEGKPWFGRQ